MKNTALILLVLALLTTLLAYWPDAAEIDQSIETNRLMQDGIDADSLQRIRIAAWDARALNMQSIEIEKSDDSWVLPGHYRYPANARARVGELAGTLLQVRLGRVLSDNMQSWNDFALYDPMEDAYQDGRRFGRRVSVWGKNGKELINIIIGASLPGDTNRRYMRFVNDHRSYAIDFDQDLPTQFKDWVDTSLLSITQAEVRSLTLRQYTFNEQSKRPQMGVNLIFKRNRVDNLWTSVNANAGDVVDDTNVERIIRSASEAQLFGVKPFEREADKMTNYGIFPNSKNLTHIVGNTPIFGNEGTLTIGCSNGMEYYIFLGEVAKPENQSLVSSGLQYRYAAVICRYSAPQDVSIDKDNVKERMLAGEQLARTLNRHFSNYIYIISEDSYQQLRPDFRKLYKKAEKQE